MQNKSILFSLGRYNIEKNHIFIVAILSLSFTISFLIRILPAQYGWELHEFDPFFNFRATEFLINNGVEKYFEWNDSLSWYPYGRDVSSNSQIILHLTTSILYWIFGGSGDLYSFTIFIPVIFGSLTCIVIFALTRVISGTTAGLFSSLFFAVSFPILVRGQLGWFKSEPLGLLLGLLGAYLFLSGIKSKNSTSVIRIISGGIVTTLAISAWGGNFFFIIPIIILIILLPLVRNDQNYLLKIIPIFTSSVLISSLFIERLGQLIFNISGIALLFSTIFMVMTIFIQKFTKFNNRLTVLVLIILIISFSILLIFSIDSNLVKLPTHRYLNSIYPLLTTTDPLTDSVSEHSTLNISQSFVFHSVLMIFASIGIWILFTNTNQIKKLSNDMKIYALVIGMFGVYIGSAFMRLEVYTSIGIIILSSTALSILIKSSLGQNKKSSLKPLIISSLLISMLMIPLFLPIDTNVIKVSSNTPQTIKNGGSMFLVSTNDWRESLEWVKENTPENSVIGSWWDYGYWIQTIGNRSTLADNSTVNDSRIETIAKLFFETPNNAWKSLQQMETDYFIIFVAAEKLPVQTEESEELFLVQGGGDESKKFWFAKIAGIEMSNYFYNDNISGTDEFWNNTFLGQAIPYQIYGYVEPQSNQFSTEYVPGWISVYTKENKFLDDNDPFNLVYSSPSYDSPIDNVVIGVFIYELNPNYNSISDNPIPQQSIDN